MVRRRVIVHGRVQGVWFRDTTRRVAVSHDVAGWARNRADGTLEAVFEGEQQAVDALLSFVAEGPERAEVERVECFEEDPAGERGFLIE